MIKQPSLILALFVIILSCKNNYENKKIPNVNLLTSKIDEAYLSLMADDIEYIPLGSDSLLSTIINVEYKNDFYFVKDNKSKFLRFNKKGGFENEIAKRGIGPGEYRHIIDFSIDNYAYKTYVLCSIPNKLNIYTTNGIFIKTINLSSKNAINVESVNNNLIIFYNSTYSYQSHNIELLDSQGNIIKQFHNKYKFKVSNSVIGFEGECLFYSFNEKLHFKEIFSDTVFFLDGMSILPKYILNSGENRLTVEARSQPESFIKNITKYVNQNKIIESLNYLFYQYYLKKENYLLIYNKKNRSSIRIDGEVGLINDLDGGPNIIIKTIKEDNIILTWIDAFSLKIHVASDAFVNSTPKFPEKKKELEKLANSLNENDNPVLMLVKLKK